VRFARLVACGRLGRFAGLWFGFKLSVISFDDLGNPKLQLWESRTDLAISFDKSPTIDQSEYECQSGYKYH